MKVLLLALAAFALSGVNAGFKINGNIQADSELGMKIMSKARRLEQNQDDAAQQIDFTWVSGYSLKFQGCHHLMEWNAYAEDADDVKVAKRRLARFRLCPTDSCTANDAGGCNDDYGDYIIDLNTFVDAYYEIKRRSDEQECENYLNNNCNCEDDGNQGDDFNAEYCEYDCFNDAGMSQCIDRNPYEDDQQQEEFDAEQYLACAQFNAPDNDDANQRRLEDAQEEDLYYIGPYCAEQGGSVYLGMFSDDSCTEFVDSSAGSDTYKDLTGESLPYRSTSLVGMECLSCLEQNDNQNDDANQDADYVAEQCENVYKYAGKCETYLPSGTVDDPNDNACKYMEGIKIAREDGFLDVSQAQSNPVVTAFIVIFAMAFAALGFYVWYLRTRLGVKRHSLM